jgi:hypothetical protein
MPARPAIEAFSRVPSLALVGGAPRIEGGSSDGRATSRSLLSASITGA